MGAGRLIALLSWVLTLSGLIDWRRGWWRSKHRTEFGLRSMGLESKFGWGPGPLDRRGWVGPTVPGVQAGRVFWGIQLGTLIHESPGDTVRLVYSLAS